MKSRSPNSCAAKKAAILFVVWALVATLFTLSGPAASATTTSDISATTPGIASASWFERTSHFEPLSMRATNTILAGARLALLAAEGDPCDVSESGPPDDDGAATEESRAGTISIVKVDGERYDRSDDDELIDFYEDEHPGQHIPQAPNGYRYEVEVCRETGTGEILSVELVVPADLVLADEAPGWYEAAHQAAVDDLNIQAPGWQSWPDRGANQIVYLDTWFYVAEYWQSYASEKTSGEVTVRVEATPTGVVYTLKPQHADLITLECDGRGEVWTPGSSGPSSCSAPPWDHSTSVIGYVEPRAHLVFDISVVQTTLDDESANGSLQVYTTFHDVPGPWDADEDDVPSDYRLHVAEVQTYGVTGDVAPTVAPPPLGPTPGGKTISNDGCGIFGSVCRIVKSVGGAILDFIIPDFIEDLITNCADAFGDAVGGLAGIWDLINPMNWDDLYNDFTALTDTLQTAASEGRLTALLAEMGGEALSGALRLDLLQDTDGNWNFNASSIASWIGYMGCDYVIGLVTGAAADKMAEFLDGALNWRRKHDNGTDNGPSDSDVNLCPAVGSSFPAGTRVLMADGSRQSIETIRPGDSVVTRDFILDRWTTRTVLDQWSHLDTGALATLALTDDSRVTATDDHLFWVESSQTWVELATIDPGVSLASPDAEPIAAAVQVSPPGNSLVWELTVEVDHNFTVFAGDVAVLVHNGCKKPVGDTSKIDAEYRRDRTDPPDIDGLDLADAKPRNADGQLEGGWATAPNPDNPNVNLFEAGDGTFIYEIDGVTVKYDANGYPDFSPYVDFEVDIGELNYRPDGTPDRGADFKAANELMDMPWGSGPPEGFTWHHVENSNTLQLVPEGIHNTFRHAGGVSTGGG